MASQGRAIYLIGHGEQLVEMREANYDSEDLLQRLLATLLNTRPKRRSRRWYSMSASKASRRRKSGQSVEVKYSSV